MEFQATKDTMGFWRRKGFIESSGSVCGKIVHNDANQLGLRVMDINEVAHALDKFPRCPLLRDLHLAPRSVRVEEDKQINRAIAPIPSSSAKQITGRFGSGGSA